MGERKPSDVEPRPVDRSYRVVIPPDVRTALGLETGDYVAFVVDGGEVRVHKVDWQLKD